MFQSAQFKEAGFQDGEGCRKLRPFVALLCSLAGTAAAAVIHIRADQPTIQQAIDAANTGDVLLVSPGTYTENISTAYIRPAVSDIAERQR